MVIHVYTIDCYVYEMHCSRSYGEYIGQIVHSDVHTYIGSVQMTSTLGGSSEMPDMLNRFGKDDSRGSQAASVSTLMPLRGYLPKRGE